MNGRPSRLRVTECLLSAFSECQGVFWESGSPGWASHAQSFQELCGGCGMAMLWVSDPELEKHMLRLDRRMSGQGRRGNRAERLSAQRRSEWRTRPYTGSSRRQGVNSLSPRSPPSKWGRCLPAGAALRPSERAWQMLFIGLQG